MFLQVPGEPEGALDPGDGRHREDAAPPRRPQEVRIGTRQNSVNLMMILMDVTSRYNHSNLAGLVITCLSHSRLGTVHDSFVMSYLLNRVQFLVALTEACHNKAGHIRVVVPICNVNRGLTNHRKENK